MKKICSILLIMFIIFSNVNIYAASVAEELQKSDSQILSISDSMRRDIDKYNEKYGPSYGIIAYILNRLQVFSIPICFAGLAISGTLTYVINARRLDQRQRGWGIMIGFLTFLVICQVLPLAFALATISWG